MTRTHAAKLKLQHVLCLCILQSIPRSTTQSKVVRYPTACKASTSILGQVRETPRRLPTNIRCALALAPRIEINISVVAAASKLQAKTGTAHLSLLICGQQLAMASSSCGLLVLACFVLLAAAADATQYKVGGDNGWAVPDATAESFNTWAEKTSFQIGDSLLFVYPKDKDSVLLVEPADYNTCNTSSYDKQFTDGSTTVTLDHAGAFFFISGVEANCRANEKLIVMVAGSATAPAPAAQPGSGSPSPSTSAPAPSNGKGGAPVPPASPKSPASKNSTAKGAPPAAGNGSNGAAGGGGLAVAGLVASVAGCVAYATLAF